MYLISIADEEDPDDPGLPVASPGVVPVATPSDLSSRGNY